MLKYNEKIFLLSAFAVLVTSSNGMNIKNLAHEKEIAPQDNCREFKYQVDIKSGPFKDWSFEQIYREEIIEGKLSKEFIAGCFVHNCVKKFEAKAAVPVGNKSQKNVPEITSLVEKVLMDHLNEHLKDDSQGVLAEKEIILTCTDPIVSMEIDHWPIVQLCKDSEGFYYRYKCSNCKKVRGKKAVVYSLQNNCKQHLLSCYKKEMNKLFEDNKDKLSKDCCGKGESLKMHACNCHCLFLKKLQ